MTDFATIRGQDHAKRAIEVAACGGHSLLLTGGPGHGKSLLSEALMERIRLFPPALPRQSRQVLHADEARAWVARVRHREGEPWETVRPRLLVLERLDCFGFSPLQIQRLGVTLDQVSAVQVGPLASSVLAGGMAIRSLRARAPPG